MLRPSVKEKMIDDILNFDVFVAIPSGEIVVPDNDGYKSSLGDDGDKRYYESEDVARIVYNAKVKKRIIKYTRVLLGRRGVKDIANINEADREVKSLLKRMRYENRMAGLGNLTETDVQSAIEMVKTKYQPMYTRTIIQIIYWAILRDSMFKEEVVNGKGAIVCNYEIQIPDDYWDTELDDEDLDEIDAALLDDLPNPIQLRQNDRLEIMVALATALVNETDEFAERVGELAAVVFAGFSFLQEDFDDAGMFQRELVRILPDFVESKYRIIDGSISGSGIYVATKKAVEHKIVKRGETEKEGNATG